MINDRKLYQSTPSHKLHDLIIVDNVMTFIPSWPLMVHLFSAFLCFGFSATYHLMKITSTNVNQFLRRLDYSGICLLIMGSDYPVIFYIMNCGPVTYSRNFFLALITTTCSGAFVVSMLPFLYKARFRAFRAIMFVVLGLSAWFPFAY